MRGTYSPEDNKLRLYPSCRLTPDEFAQVKAAGFQWAPRQKLFVAPMWTPARFDLLQEFCGEVEDEDSSLVERATERADRFETYRDNRAADAERAHKAVKAITNNIPFGQPILVGHHSEKHARRDAKRIDNGMRKAVSMWETSKYWQERAAGALHAAKYKDKPGVRARRIKTLGAEMRKYERDSADAAKKLALWSKADLSLEQALVLVGFCSLNVIKNDETGVWWSAWDVLRPDEERYGSCPGWTVEQVVEAAKTAYPKTIARCARWIEHYQLRIAYETAMLEEQGATHLIQRTARPKQAAIINTPEPVTLKGRYGNPPQTVTPHHMTKAQYAATPSENRGCMHTVEGFRVKSTIIPQDGKPMYAWKYGPVFLTDSKTHKIPASMSVQPSQPAARPEPRPTYKRPEPTVYDAMKDQLKTGIQITVADQLFPTPAHLVARMIDMADIQPSHRVLEPSAGTGAILKAIGPAPVKVAVEINPSLAEGLSHAGLSGLHIHRRDFLECNGDLGLFDRILMNPPFSKGQDIRHINHALAMLKPGGLLVAICANGPHQQAQLKPLVEQRGGSWEPLPADTFKQSGTGVNAVLLSIPA